MNGLQQAIDKAVATLDSRLQEKLDPTFLQDLETKLISAKINIDSGMYDLSDIRFVFLVLKNLVIPSAIKQQINKLETLKECRL